MHVRTMSPPSDFESSSPEYHEKIRLIFSKLTQGLTTPQTIVILHRQRGDANLTFEVRGKTTPSE